MTETGNADAPAGESAAMAETAVDAHVSVGQRLRRARTTASLSVTDVASALKFSPRQVEALESDDFASLHGATLIRGFVRSYARLLKLNPEDLLAQLDGTVPRPAGEIRPMPGTGAEMPHDLPRRQTLRWMVTALVLAAVAGAVSYFVEWPADGPSSLLPTRGDERPDATGSSPARTTDAAPPAAQVQPTPEVIATPHPAAVGAQAESAVVDPEARRLVFTFTGTAWVEVRDATQKTLLSQNNPAGTVQSVAGRPPFQVVVGNAAQVRLQYEDREVDLLPHIRAEVARFSLE